MAFRSRRGLSAVLALGLIAAACSPESAEPSTTSTSTNSTTTTLATPTTTTQAAPTTTISAPTSTTQSGERAEIDARVGVPDGEGPFPAVVLVHGGGWISGDRSAVQPLADYLTDDGYLTVNTSYQLSSFDIAGFPVAADNVACAVRFARSHPDSDGTVTIIGHSAGAHIGALVALAADDFADDCAIGGSALPDRFVGLAGPYDTDRLGVAVLLFFGAGPNLIPDVWEAGNPQLQTDRNPDLESLIMYGEFDGLVESSFAINFHEALIDSGSESLLELVEGARHGDMDDPDWVGDLILAWLAR